MKVALLILLGCATYTYAAVVKCPPVPNPTTSKPDTFAKKAGTVVNYVCKGRYPNPIAGAESNTCLEDGTWSDDPLECEEDDPLAKCPSPPRTGENSKKVQGIKGSRRVGGYAQYECRAKFPYKVGGSEKITCQEDGTFDGQPLDCSETPSSGGGKETPAPAPVTPAPAPAPTPAPTAAPTQAPASSEMSEIACEHDNLLLSCPSGTLKILSANYGRTAPDSQVCPYGKNHKDETDCRSADSLDKVQAICNDQNSCSISASNGEFGDPCRGTYKYLEVTYNCGN
jgi:hypothetical protein